VDVEIAGANPQTLEAAWEGSGYYTATYVPESPGTDAFEVSIDGMTIDPSPASAVAPLGPDPSTSTLQVSSSQAGAPTTIQVTVKDTNGGPYMYGASWPINVVLTVSGANSFDGLALVDDDGTGTYDGVFTTSYIPSRFGTDRIQVAINGIEVGGGGVTVFTAPRPADPLQSSVSSTEAEVGSPTVVSVTVRNTAGEIYDYGDIRSVLVQVNVSGTPNSTTFEAVDEDEAGVRDGIFVGSYTPAVPGTDVISVFIDGGAIPGEIQSRVVPRIGDLVVDVDIAGSAPEDGLPVALYRDGDPNVLLSARTDGAGTATFTDLELGAYTVHLPARDFDVQFPAGMTQRIEHDQTSTTVYFVGETQVLPESVGVFRLKESGGNGHAYRYVEVVTGWETAVDLARGAELLGVSGHLATVSSSLENLFLARLLEGFPDRCTEVPEPKPGKCFYRGWIGLTDRVVEGDFRWETEEPLTFMGWEGWEEGLPVSPPLDEREGLRDFVEMNGRGTWGTTDGTERTNEGYFVEFEVEPPPPPPPPGG
jgi:hypothetical protein